MRVTHLSGSNLWASQLCPGTLNTGAKTGEPAADGIRDPGSTGRTASLVRTANRCGGTGRGGWTGELIGRWVEGICPGERTASEDCAW